MIYPALVFGIALLEEDKPGKKFWFFVVYYTCAILLMQCVAQLALWENSFQKESYTIYTDLQDYNFGLVYIPPEDYNNLGQMIWWFAPEIGIIISTLVLIQKETLAGIFDVSLS